MKSMLFEASSVPKAVEKAWQGSGKPDEFTIKIYETEKRGFLGFAKRSAVVSIIFDPRKSETRVKKQKPKVASSPSAIKRNQQPYQNRASQQRPRLSEGAETRTQESYNSWNAELVDYMRISLKEVVDIMGIKEKFSVKVDRHLLRIDFDKPVIEAPSEERMLFASFAYLLMQFLKRKYKKGFKGCRIAISSARR